MKISKETIKLFKKGYNLLKAGDYDDGFYFIRKSAKKGYAPAQFRTACSYNTGTGVQKDRAQAVYWWKLAGEQGHLDAQFFSRVWVSYW